MDYNIIIRKYKYLTERLNKIKEYLSQYEKEDKNKKEILYLALQRLVEETVESAIKINIYILKEKKIFPKTYQESFLKLEKIIEMDKKELEKLSQTARFRNILAHEYEDLSEENFIIKAKEIVNIYPRYLKQIYNNLEKIKQ